MISCEHAHNLFDAYLNDDLSGAMTAELDAHLLDCTACQHQLSLIEACGNVIRLDTSEPNVAGDFTDRLMAIIDQKGAPRRSLQLNRSMKIAGGLLGIAAAIALVLMASSFGSDNKNAPLVAGDHVNPPVQIPAVDSITSEHFGFPLFDAIERGASVVELGDTSLRKFSDSGIDPSGVLDAVPETPHPAQGVPAELDVTGTLPDLESDGEDL